MFLDEFLDAREVAAVGRAAVVVLHANDAGASDRGGRARGDCRDGGCAIVLEQALLA